MHPLYFSLVLVVISSFLHRSRTSLSSPFHHPHPMTHLTVRQQFCHLNYIPSAVCLLLPHSRTLTSHSPFLLVFLLLSGHIELNQNHMEVNKTNFSICTLNIGSILHPLHSAAICDLSDAHNLDFFGLTETCYHFCWTSQLHPSQLHLTQCPAQTLW